MTLTEIKQALAQHQLSPLKQLGQNFLYDQNMAIAIAQRAVGPEEGRGVGNCLVEIGPGLGSLTEHLLERAALPLVALEKDRGLCQFLRGRFAKEISDNRLVLIEGDALQTLPQLIGPASGMRVPSVIIGNLPYNISTPLLMLCWEHFPAVRTAFLLQKEVGQRIASAPNSKIYGALSVILQTFYAIQLVRTVPSSVFYPAPDVQSVVLECIPRPAPAIPLDQRVEFAQVVHRGFSQRRKKLSNLLECGDDRRAEQLSPPEWVELWRKSRLSREDDSLGH